MITTLSKNWPFYLLQDDRCCVQVLYLPDKQGELKLTKLHFLSWLFSDQLREKVPDSLGIQVM